MTKFNTGDIVATKRPSLSEARRGREYILITDIETTNTPIWIYHTINLTYGYTNTISSTYIDSLYELVV